MSFLLPAMLAGLAALAIPVIVHLRFREKDTPFRFPSLMFLVRIPIRTAQRRHLTDWPLFLVRALALTALVIAFARPFLPPRDGAAEAASARSVVLVIDRSLSMSHTAVWPAALDSARGVISGLSGADRVAIVAFDESSEIILPWTADASAARAAVDGLLPVARGTRFGAALRSARQLLAEAGAARPEAIVVTDLQRSGVTGLAGIELPTGMLVRAIAVAPPSRANSAVTSVEIRRATDGPRPTVTAQARVVSRELAAPRPLRAVLTINGREAATRSVTLPPDGEFTIAFEAVPAPAGRITGTISLEPDALTADDTLYFALPRDDAVRVLLVTPAEGLSTETLFFERAIGIGEAPAIRVTSTTAATLTAAQFSDAGLVVLWDVAAPAALTDALGTWVDQGGGIVTVLGTRLGGRTAASTLLPASAAGLTERAAADPAVLGEVTLDHPLFSPFREASAALSAVRFSRYPRLDPAAGAAVLARFDDGLPAVIEARRGAGRLLAVATPLEPRGGDFPLQPAFLPFLRRLVLHGSGHAGAPLWRPTGDSWALRASLRDPVVSGPDAALERPDVDSAGSAVVLRSAGLYSAYQGRVGGEPVAVVAANAPAAESDLTPVDARELLLGTIEVPGGSGGFAAKPTAVDVEASQGAWRWFLAIVVALLIAETLLATRGWRATARRSAVIPPDRSSA